MNEDSINMDVYKIALVEKLEIASKAKESVFEFLKKLEGQTVFAWRNASVNNDTRGFRKVKRERVQKDTYFVLDGVCDCGINRRLSVTDIKAFEDL